MLKLVGFAQAEGFRWRFERMGERIVIEDLSAAFWR